MELMLKNQALIIKERDEAIAQLKKYENESSEN